MQALELVNEFATALLVAVLNSAWATAVAGWAAWLGVRSAVRLNAATRYTIWWAVAAFIVGAPLIYLIASQSAEAVAVSMSSDSTVSAEPATSRAVPPGAPATQAFSAPTPVSAVPVDWNAGFFPTGVLGIWMVLFALQLGRVGWSYAWLGRLKRRAQAAPQRLRIEFDEWVLATATRRRVRLLISDEIESPVAVGFRNAAVILPARMAGDLPQEDLDHVLLHEIAHLARRDDWMNLLARILAGAFALHPVAIFVLRRIEQERELACDDWVVTATGAAKEYAGTLSRLVEFRLERRRTLLASGVAGRGNEIFNRISRLLDSGSAFECRVSPLRAGAAIGVLAILMAACAVAPPWIVAADEPAPPDERATTAAPAEQESTPVVEPGTRAVAAPAAPALSRRRAVVTPRAPAAPAVPAPKATTHEALALPQPRASRGLYAEHANTPAVAASSGAAVAEAPPPPALAVPAEASPVPPAVALAAPSPSLAPAPQVPGAPRAATRSAVAQPPVPRAVAAPPVRHTGGSSLLAALVSNGYADLSVDEIIDLKTQGVTAEYLSGMVHAWGTLTPGQLIEARHQSVSPDYAARVRAAGVKDITVAGLIELRRHGADPEIVQQIHRLGFGPYTVREIIYLRNRGVRPELFRALKEAGFPQPDLRDVVDARMHGLTAEHLRDAANIGNRLTMRQIIRLKQAGVIQGGR